MMKTGLKKSQKTTEIFFDEASRWITVNTYNTDLKNRLTAYAKNIPICAGLPMTQRMAVFSLRLRKVGFVFG